MSAYERTRSVYERTASMYEHARMDAFCAHTMPQNRLCMSARTPHTPRVRAAIQAGTHTYGRARARSCIGTWWPENGEEVAGNSSEDSLALFCLSEFWRLVPGRPRTRYGPPWANVGRWGVSSVPLGYPAATFRWREGVPGYTGFAGHDVGHDGAFRNEGQRAATQARGATGRTEALSGGRI